MKFEVLEMTPDIARELLGRSRGNRKLQQRQLATMASDMLAGRWRLTVEAIQLDTRGVLINGHHRLTAYLAASEQDPSITIPFTLAHDVPDDSVGVIDQGAQRTTGQVLTWTYGMPAGPKLAATASMILRYDKFPDRVWTGLTGVSKAEVIAFVQANEQSLRLANYQSTSNVMRTSWFSALAYLVSRDSANADQWEPFAEAIRTGANLAIDDPRLLLREGSSLMRWGNGQSDLGRAIRAWNLYVQDKPIKHLIYRRSSLPMPAVL